MLIYPIRTQNNDESVGDVNCETDSEIEFGNKQQWELSAKFIQKC